MKLPHVVRRAGWLYLSGIAAAIFAPSAAMATVLNFAGLAAAGTGFNFVGSSYTQSGFTVSGSDLFTWQSGNANLPDLSAADTSLFEYYAGATDTLTVTGGGAFTLTSIDLAPLLAGSSGSFMVELIGTFADSSTVMQDCTVNDGSPTMLQTCSVSGFANVVSVGFAQGSNGGFFETQDTGYQFDNVVVTAASGMSMPEPATLGLLGLSLTGIACVRRRRPV
ncbi:MAG TPA: PEP-CTERM sorting domain-containing protein [Acetobacteraceae bacterium]|nr:PEP-CTERM sorting domain-containing protein [Acetobacteraceae bacterium]